MLHDVVDHNYEKEMCEFVVLQNTARYVKFFGHVSAHENCISGVVICRFNCLDQFGRHFIVSYSVENYFSVD